MKKEIYYLKSSILCKTPEKDYNEMVNMIADSIYNKVEYDVIILLARKFSQFYTAMLPLVKEEYDGLLEETHQKLLDKYGKKELIVLTDRALDWVVWSIRKEIEPKEESAKIRIRRILLADDIIIHGRTLMRVKQRLEKEFKKAGIEDFEIEIAAFAVNAEELLIKKQRISNWNEIRKCTASDWKLLSGEIVNTIYLMGQTYTSYVPNARFKMQSESGQRIRDYIEKNQLQFGLDKSRSDLGMKSYIYVVEGMKEWNICESYRIYEFLHQQEYVIVPMVTMQPVDEICLEEYMESILKYLICCQPERMEDFFSHCSGEYKYRLVLYTLSALMGWKFLYEKVGICDTCYYDKSIENLNFYFVDLKNYDQILDEKIDLDLTLGDVSFFYQKMKNRNENTNIAKEIQDDDVSLLDDQLDKVIEETSRCNMQGNILGKILIANNKIDEERYIEAAKREDKNIQDRTIGIPLVNVVQKLAENKWTLKDIFRCIFREIDGGRGSIVVHCFHTLDNRRIYTSLMHAGEENYRYYIDHYLPVLYGLCILEFRGNSSASEDDKNRYWEEFYAQVTTMNYLPSDREYLLQSKTLRQLKDVVRDAALFQATNPYLKIAIEKTKIYTR